MTTVESRMVYGGEFADNTQYRLRQLGTAEDLSA